MTVKRGQVFVYAEPAEGPRPEPGDAVLLLDVEDLPDASHDA